MTLAYHRNERLDSHTTFRIGGPAKALVECRSIEDLREAFQFAKTEKLQVLVLGGGSNVLIGDSGWEGLVIKMGIPGITYHEEDESIVVVAGAGVGWDEFVADTVSRGFWGLENLSGIPGTVGASPIQNIGAYGKEVASIIEWVEVYDAVADNVRRLSPTMCQFGYRESLFKKPLGMSLTVTHVAFRLSYKGSPQLGYKDFAQFPELVNATIPQEVRDAVLHIRSKKFPVLTEVGTAGSFFKNPFVSASHAEELAKRYPGLPVFDTATGMKKISAAWIIDHVIKMRGEEVGNVGTYKGQALVIVAKGSAHADEVVCFAKNICHLFRQETHVTLSPEVRMINCGLE